MLPTYIKYADIAIAGSNYENRSDFIKYMNMLTELELRREPTNPYDSCAIAVYAKFEKEWKHIGYIPKSTAKKITTHLNNESSIIHTLLKSIRREPMFDRELNRTKTFFVVEIDVTLKTKSIHQTKEEREVRLQNLDYTENRFYFENIFKMELEQRLEEIYKFCKKNSSSNRAGFPEFDIDDILNKMQFNDLAANVGIISDFLHLLDICLVYESHKNKYKLVYNGKELRDSTIIEDLYRISELDSNEYKELEQFDKYKSFFNIV